MLCYVIRNTTNYRFFNYYKSMIIGQAQLERT